MIDLKPKVRLGTRPVRAAMWGLVTLAVLYLGWRAGWFPGWTTPSLWWLAIAPFRDTRGAWRRAPVWLSLDGMPGIKDIPAVAVLAALVFLGGVVGLVHLTTPLYAPIVAIVLGGLLLMCCGLAELDARSKQGGER